MEEKESVRQVEAMKRLAFLSITISTLATVTAIVLIPSIYTYLQNVQSMLQNEVDFCQHRTDTLVDEFSKIDNHDLFKFHTKRRKRESVHRSSGVSSASSFGDDPNATPRAKDVDNFGLNSPDYVEPRQVFSSPPASSPLYAYKKTEECCSCGVGLPGAPVSFLFRI
jgi:hypothetical protein